MQRDNESWLIDLNAEGEQRDQALTDLRDLLLRILPQTLNMYLSPDGGNFDPFLDDVTQETIIRVVERLDTFQGRSKFTTWVYKIAIRIALSELRLRKWKEVSLDGLEESPETDQMPSEKFSSLEPSLEEIFEINDTMGFVKRILQEELTARQRSVMMAITMEEVPLDVVAERLGTNRNAIYKMMHDARLKLKHRLEREGLAPEELLKMFSN